MQARSRTDILGERLRSREQQLSPRLLAVAHYLHTNRETVLDSTAMDIARANNTSDATVIRAIQALGFSGLRDLKNVLQAWFGPGLSSEEKMLSTVNAMTREVLSSIDFVLQGHLHACQVLASEQNRQALAEATGLLSEARQVAVFGINASGILADYTARLLNRIGLPAFSLNRSGIALAEQMLALQRGDVLIMMAQKSAHREGTIVVREAKRLGIPIILLTHATDAFFAREADVVIDVPRGGEKGRIPLHGTVMVCLEMLILSVAASLPDRTTKTMKRLQDFYRGLKPAIKK
ncbi:MurR/RpiR family transcriptional regulator [Pantoea stewartii]|uniref:RpiR family transcriptional regulator n=1 Tax=Pantoea stewartii TaxID=66269 RepID=A0AB34VE89_9GAMM|nr:MurR/RpiR family transcriptional regulator [Pantoea stewartii]KTS73625.1 RpiR family transcriptional regulator [Pantoea stewartii]KTS96575.1 RpiR family transcriptional regulator [Pantoea stewartii]KTT06287.1 RpiR family transcriptional regulator [Pantoea stewartii]